MFGLGNPMLIPITTIRIMMGQQGESGEAPVAARSLAWWAGLGDGRKVGISASS